MWRADQPSIGAQWDKAFSAVSAEGGSFEDKAPQSESPEPSGASCKVIIVERNPFLRDCLSRSVSAFSTGSAAFSSLSEIQDGHVDQQSTVLLLSIMSLSEEEADNEFALLADIDPQFRTMVLAKTDDLNEALAALSQGANGYISMSAGLEIVIQALRFVSAGGTYVPAQCLFAAKQASPNTADQASTSAITSRELAVIQAIRQGKPNKVIAYELNMCESTVKVHVRHIMKKLQAKNRTDVAIKGADLAMSSTRIPAPASSGRAMPMRMNMAKQ